MSVPLDRLYNFLHDISDRALLIYRWNPHGSKKIADLTQLTDCQLEHSKDKNLYPMICHDQEPLQYNFYSESDIHNHIEPFFDAATDTIEKHWIQLQINFLSKMHLRGVIFVYIGDRFRVHDKMIILHSEKRSRQLQIYESNNYIGVYYWCHALIAADWFRYAPHDPCLTVNFDYVQKDFLIYNRAWSGTREYRLTFMHSLVQQQLQAHCLTSFADSDSGCNYLAHEFSNPALAVDLAGLAAHFPANVHDSTASADYNHDDYSSTAIEVVLETLFDDNRLHLTEKTLRPIACGRPFILMAGHGSLQYLRDYGFRTFDGLIDETYDIIQDPKQRLDAVVLEMSRIAALDKSEKHKLWIKLYEISEFNQRLFFSESWQQSICQEFLTNLSKAFRILNQYQNKDVQEHYIQLWNNYLKSKSL
jgi:hypothetical protein